MLIGARKRAEVRKGVDKASGGPSNDTQEGGRSSTQVTAGVVCRSLELMTALGMLEDHNRLLLATKSVSGPVSVAVRNRGVLVLTCFLVALGSSLCVEKESLAKQPAEAAKSGAFATSDRPTSPRPEAAPTAVHRAPVDQGPSSRPTQQRPVELPGGRSTQFERPAYEPPGSMREPGRGPAGNGPVGPDSVRHHPEPEKVDRELSSRPVHERTAPQTTAHYPRGNESAGPQEDARAPDRQDKPASLPAKDKVHPERRGFVAQPEQTLPRPEAVGSGPVEKPGNGAYQRPVHTDASSNAPDGGTPAIGAEEPLERQPPAWTTAGSESGPETTTPGVEASERRDEEGIFGPRSVDLRKEKPTGPARPLSAHSPARQAVVSSRTVDLAPAGKQRPVAEQAQVAWDTPFGSARLLFDTLWDERGSLVGLTQAALRSLPGDERDLSTGALYGGSLTQRAPPLEVPSPFFGFVPMMGGAASGFGSSGNGVAPLLAVIAPCLIALLYRDRSRIFCAFLRPITMPRPALERPG
jgi:hypothetical protein